MAKYDPSIKYGWEKETPFTLNGNEFGLILNTFRTILSSPEAQKILLLEQANNAMETVLQRNVESGVIKPAIEESIPDMPPKMEVLPPEKTTTKKQMKKT